MASLNQHRVYIPSSARANQYVLVEFKPTDEFVRQCNKAPETFWEKVECLQPQ